jgi:hypothetical protein
MAYHGLKVPRNVAFAQALASMPIPEDEPVENLRKIGALMMKVFQDERRVSIGRLLVRAMAGHDAIASRVTAENQLAAGAFREALIWYLVAMLRGEIVSESILDDLRSRFSESEYEEIIKSSLSVLSQAE